MVLSFLSTKNLFSFNKAVFAGVFLSLVLFSPLSSAIELVIVGDANHPVAFKVQPFKYEGEGVSPAIEMERIISISLSNNGLFHQPLRQPATMPTSSLEWQSAGIHYLINGVIRENNGAMGVRLTVEATHKGAHPHVLNVELHPETWQIAMQLLSQKIFYHLFYNTYTDQSKSRNLNDDKDESLDYLVHLVRTVKNHWSSEVKSGHCVVNLKQLPGGNVQSFAIEKDCDNKLEPEINAIFSGLDDLPYEEFKAQFMRYLRFHFMAVE